MGDLGEYWRDHKDHVKKVKEQYRGKSDFAISLLDKANIEYYQLSHEHYRLPLTNDFIDWWPSTGKWRSKDGKSTGFEVKSLIKEYKKRESSNHIYKSFCGTTKPTRKSGVRKKDLYDGDAPPWEIIGDKKGK